MLKKIRVQQLEIGMYLEEFCCSWMEHPFWRSGFVITDAKDIERIRDSRVSEVWIDRSKGIDIAPDKDSVSVADAQSRIETELNQIALQERPIEATPETDDYRHAAQLCIQAKPLIESIFQQARMGRSIDTTGAKELVEEILESVSHNDCALANLVRLKTSSDFTFMHSVAVCVLMVSLSKRLGLDRQQTSDAGLAGLLHDLGKAAIPIDVLHKPGKLSESEYVIVKQHPEQGSRILQKCGINGTALDVCLNHHARIDGAGYPCHIKGSEISIYARMAAVCDVYDAISSGRPYKEAWDPAESMRKMAEWTNGHFDPVVFHAFVKTIGIYPVGSLIRLASQRLGVVVGQSAVSLLTPKVKVFFSTKLNARITPLILDLSDPGCTDRIEAREDPAKWNFPDLVKLWSGLTNAPWQPLPSQKKPRII